MKSMYWLTLHSEMSTQRDSTNFQIRYNLKSQRYVDDNFFVQT